MSKTVVSAATKAEVKAFAGNNNSAPVAEGQQPAHDDQEVIDTELEEGIVVESDPVEEQTEVSSETALAANSSFEDALLAAADSAASLISEAEAADEAGFAMSNDEDGDGTGIILLVGALGLVGLGIAALAGGGNEPSNTPPSFGSATQAVTVNEDGTLTITATATDADGDALTYTNTTAANGTLTNNGNGTFTFVPNANFNGSSSFVVTATDPSGESATQTVNITVTAVNDRPVAGNDTATTAEDTAVTINVLANDSDVDTGTTLTVTAGNGANGTTTVNANGSVVYTPGLNFNGTDTFTYTVNDGSGAANATATATVTVNVTPVNDAPGLGPSATTSLIIAEDTSGEIVIDVVDVDSPEASLGFSVVSGPANGTFTNVGGANTYTPNANFNGADAIVIQLTDGMDTFTYTVGINVTPVNDAPTVAPSQAVTVDEDSSVAVVANASDVDGDTLSFNVSDPANGEVITGSGGNFTYMPNANFNGTDTFTITVSDPGGLTAQQVVTVTVTPQPEIVSLDVEGPNPTTPAQIDAGADEFDFRETAAGNSNVIVTGFGLNDMITATGATSADYNFGTGTDPNDLQITFNPGGSTNIILLDDILAGSDNFVFNYDTAVAAVQESLGDNSFVFLTFA